MDNKLKNNLFDTTSNHNVKDIGSKAYNLLKMEKAGFNVPPFFILSQFEIESLFEGILPEIENNLIEIISPDNYKLPSICNSIRQLILEYNFSEELSHQILKKCKSLFGDNYRIAVRSSAMSEDSTNKSFAGQHATFLYCSEDTVIQKIKECMASAWSYNAISYRLIHGVSIRNIKYAIILQKMEFAEKSGICFSMNSNGNLADAVINAGYGIGEGIVTDKVETDSFYINRTTKSIYKNCVLKKNAIIFENQIITTSVHKDLQSKPVLNDDEILMVYDLSFKAENILGKPADIEFLYTSKGELFILQMRPITTINIKDIVVLDNTNIVESYPGITLPLSFSFAAVAYSNVFRNSAKAFWVSAKKFNLNNNVFDNLLSHFYGRIYYRLDSWYKMMALVYNSKKSMQAWENAVGLPDSASDTYHFSISGKLKTILSSIWLILNYKKGNKKFFKHFKINYNLFQQYDQYLQSPALLWNYFDDCMQKTFQKWHLTIVNDYLAFKSFGWLQDLIKKYKISETQDFANELVCGYSDVESEIALINFLSLRDMIISSTELSAIFKLNEKEILTIIQQQKLPEFTEKWKTYLDRFGDRTLAELKLETKSPRKNPELLIQLLKNQLNSELLGESYKLKKKQGMSNANKIVKEHFQWWMPKYWLFIFVLKLARYGLMNRENMRFCRTRVYSISKDIFVEFGIMMVKAGIIDETDDIFYLNMKEIRDYSINNIHECKQKKIIELKENFKIYSKGSLPDRIIYSLNDVPDFSTFSNSNSFNDHSSNSNSDKILQGIAVSKGIAEGYALVITEPALNANVKGKILVTKMTDPGWVFLMSQSIALISEKGSLLSHTAIVGRELGIPVIVGVQDVIQKIKTGDKIRVNGSSGIIELLS